MHVFGPSGLERMVLTEESKNHWIGIDRLIAPYTILHCIRVSLQSSRTPSRLDTHELHGRAQAKPHEQAAGTGD